MDDDSDLRAASDLRTPPAALAALAQRGGEYAAAVASNPGAPPGLLQQLLKNHPDRVMTNPAWDLALLAMPTLVQRAGFLSHRAMAASPALTPAVAEALVEANDRAAVRLLARNPACPPSLLERFAVSAEADLRAEAAANPSTPPRLPALLRKAGAAGASRHLDLAASTITGDELAELSRALHWGRQVACVHPHSPPALLAEIARSNPPPHLLVEILNNPACPRELLAGLASHESPRVRCAIARNIHTTTGTLGALLETDDKEPWPLAVALLEHPGLPPAMIERLARGRLDIPQVVRRAAAHPNAPLSLLLAIHDRGEVPGQLALAFAKNPSFPAGRLAQIHAAQRPPDRHFEALMAARTDADPALLVQFTGRNHHPTRQAAMANPRLPAPWRALLERAGFLPDLKHIGSLTAPLSLEEMTALAGAGAWLRYYLLQRPELPTPLLLTLARHHGRELGALLRKREGVPESVLELLPGAQPQPGPSK